MHLSFIKNSIKRIKTRSQLFILLKRKPEIKSTNLYVHSPKSVLDIITIAFNNAKTIDYQIRLIKKNLKDSYDHIVADNSNLLEKRNEILSTCEKHNVRYVSIPRNPFQLNASHAAAMHWVYKNVVRPRNRPYFGFIDHDIYPLEPCSVVDRMKCGIYGRVTPAYGPNEQVTIVSDKQPYWSLWAGFYFLKSELLSKLSVYKINFFPKFTDNGLYLDTGGMLWDTILKDIPYPRELASYSNRRFRETQGGNIHTDFYEILDEWIHIGNLSEWHKTENKDSYFEKLLSEALQG